MILNKFLSYLMVASIFLGALAYDQGGFEFYLNYLVFGSVIFIFFVNSFKFYINKFFLALMFALMVISLVNAFLLAFPSILVFRQLFGIILSALAYYLLIKINNYDVEKIFKMYLYVALVLCLVGLFQELSYILNFTAGYDYCSFLPKWRVVRMGGLLRINSILMEPAVFAIVLSPAMYLALNNLFSKTKAYLNTAGSLVILITYLFTFSAVGYLGLICAIALALYKNNYFNLKSKKALSSLLVLPISLSLIFGIYLAVPEINKRVSDSLSLFLFGGYSAGNQIDRLVAQGTNLSTFVMYVNYKVALDSFMQRPLFGSGLGSYVVNYDKYVDDNNLSKVEGIIFNRSDGAALFFRLLAETGLVGTFVIFYLLYKYFLKRDKRIVARGSLSNLSIINNGIFILIILRIFRLGHYFVDGFFFFIFLYYLSYEKYKQARTSEAV